MSVPESTRQELALELLAHAADAYQRAKTARDYFAARAREHGVSNLDIAAAYGVSEAAVRAMAKRDAQRAAARVS